MQNAYFSFLANALVGVGIYQLLEQVLTTLRCSNLSEMKLK